MLFSPANLTFPHLLLARGAAYDRVFAWRSGPQGVAWRPAASPGNLVMQFSGPNLDLLNQELWLQCQQSMV